MNFNKIKNILNGGPEELIRKSLNRSTLLELSEDGTKVRRKDDAPIKTQDEIDECTIYVEQIPLNSTHESISSIFSAFGKVNYVSLPRYKKSRQIKQFGFVEFDSEESITKAINCFKKCDGVLQFSSLKAENLLSIVTHEKEETETAEKLEENDSEEPPTKKARIDIQVEVKAEVEAFKVEDAEQEKSSVEVKEEKAVESAEETEPAAESSEAVEGEAKKKKKNRHHKKKPGRKAFFDERIMAMKIMRKKEWKKMRNAYLNLERQKAKEIKKVLRETYNKRNNNKAQKFSPAINFYGSPNDREEQNVEPTVELDANPSSGLVFIPGVIVNIKFREPCLDFKELKKEFKQYSFINYVDILEGGAQCYIRVDSSNSAQELVSLYSSCEYETEILKDEAEKEYWKKIFEKRDGKKSKDKDVPKKEQKPVKRRRGREKLLDKINKAAQHIRFDDEVVE